MPMTDATTGTAAPPKKRSFFKKAAWQTAAQAGEGQELDMFSHSNEFRDIIAEETRKKNEERRKVEEAHKRKAEEQRERKRRRVSLESEERQTPRRGSGSSTHGSRICSNSRRSKTPLSPLESKPAPDSLAARYDSLTKAPCNSPLPHNDSVIIDLGDSDDEYMTHSKTSPSPFKETLPINSVQSASTTDIEEVEDPYLAALRAKSRAKGAERAARASNPSARHTNGGGAKTATVQLFITSVLPNTNPLIVKIKTDATIERVKKAWCGKQGFTAQQTENMFMVWKNTIMFDSTTIQRLGVNIDDNGTVTVDGDSALYDDLETFPKIHLDVWTKETWDQRKKEEAEEAEAKKKAAELPQFVEEPQPDPKPEVKTIRLILRAKGKDDFRITVYPETEFSHLATVYKQKHGIPPDQPITLMFDGERLRPMDTVADTDLEDLEGIEVHFK